MNENRLSKYPILQYSQSIKYTNFSNFLNIFTTHESMQ